MDLTPSSAPFRHFFQFCNKNSDSDEDDDDDDQMEGYWQRRRRLDGALNRVPLGFYTKVCHSIHLIALSFLYWKDNFPSRFGRSWRNASRSECKQPTLCSTDSLRRYVIGDNGTSNRLLRAYLAKEKTMHLLVDEHDISSLR